MWGGGKHSWRQIHQSISLHSASGGGRGESGRPPPCPLRRARAGRRASARRGPGTGGGPRNAHVPVEGTHSGQARPRVHTLRAHGRQRGSDQASPLKSELVTRRSPVSIHEHAHVHAHTHNHTTLRYARGHACTCMNTHARGIKHQRMPRAHSVPARAMTPLAHVTAGLVRGACSVARKQCPPAQPLCSPAPSRQSGGSRVSACRGPRVPGSACNGARMCRSPRVGVRACRGLRVMVPACNGVCVCRRPRVPTGPGAHTGRGCHVGPGLSGSAARTGCSGRAGPSLAPDAGRPQSFAGVSPGLAWQLEPRRAGRVLHPGWDTGTRRLGNPSVRDRAPAAGAEWSGRHRGPAPSHQVRTHRPRFGRERHSGRRFLTQR